MAQTFKIEGVIDAKGNIQVVAGEAKEAVDKLGDSGKSLGEKFSGAAGVAKGVAIELAALAAAATGAGYAAYALTDRVARIGDDLLAMSQKTGISVESLSQWRYAATLSNTSMESLSVGLRGLSNNIDAASRGNKEASEQFNRLGISIRNQDGTLKSTNQLMIEITDRFQQMPDGAQKSAMAMQLFGRAGIELIPLLNEGGKGLQNMSEEAEKLGVTWDTETAVAADRLRDNVDKLKFAGEGVAKQFAGPMMTALSATAEALLQDEETMGWLRDTAHEAGVVAGKAFLFLPSLFFELAETGATTAGVIVGMAESFLHVAEYAEIATAAISPFGESIDEVRTRYQGYYATLETTQDKLAGLAVKFEEKSEHYQEKLAGEMYALDQNTEATNRNIHAKKNLSSVTSPTAGGGEKTPGQSEVAQIRETENQKTEIVNQEAQKRAQTESKWSQRKANIVKSNMLSEISAYKSAASTMGQLLGLGVKQQAMVMIPFEIAETTKAFAAFLATKDPSQLASSLQHALAVRQYAEAAKTGAPSGGGVGGGGGGGGGGYGGGPSTTPETVAEPAPAHRAHVIVNVGDGVVVNPKQFTRDIVDGLNAAYRENVRIEFA